MRIFRYDGTNYHLLAELLVSAITPSNTVVAWYGDWVPISPHLLNAGDKIYMSTSIAQAFDATAISADY